MNIEPQSVEVTRGGQWYKMNRLSSKHFGTLGVSFIKAIIRSKKGK